jgi:hypothetical protein
MENKLALGFPTDKRLEVSKVLRVIRKWPTYYNTKITLLGGATQFMLGDEPVDIIYRQYYREPPSIVWLAMSDVQKQIACCIYSRSSDGFVREKYVRKLLDCKNLPVWCLPYVLKVCDEYVIEILQAVWSNYNKLNQADVAVILKNNRPYMNKSYDRMVSYWNCYYRTQYPDIRDYVGFWIYEKLGAVAVSSKKQHKHEQ